MTCLYKSGNEGEAMWPCRVIFWRVPRRPGGGGWVVKDKKLFWFAECKIVSEIDRKMCFHRKKAGKNMEKMARFFLVLLDSLQK